MDHAGANYHLLTYTSWPRHTGLFSITSLGIRLQLSFLFLARRAAWLHLHQVRTIMCDWRKCQLLIFPTVLMVGSRAQAIEAGLFSPLPHSFLQFTVQSRYLCFLLCCAEHCNPNITDSSRWRPFISFLEAPTSSTSLDILLYHHLSCFPSFH